ncbi:MAG: filamentous hemagglutinin family protein [Aquabacterium sp.]
MARRHTTRPRIRTSAARRAFTRRMKPVAHAALFALMLAGGHQMAAAGIRVSVAQPYAPIRAKSYTVDASGIKAPASNALPVSEKAMKDDNGNLVNIASTGDVRGMLSSMPGLDTLTLTQYTKQAIVRFSSFDIGSRAAVNANMTQADSTALYQITSTTDPTKIFGSLTSNGTLYLINQNGILFGPSAQVNVQGIFASTMKVDETDYQSNLDNSTKGNTATFWADGSGLATYAPEKAFVKVAQGAKITTGSGGKVFLLGGQVENAGEITSPDGQVVLAAGTQVYLAVPDAGSTPIYMAETNKNVPTVKGVLVEVNGRQIDSEFATNTGSISTPTGNATIVGWAVNQMGRISATTSLSKNGSVYLLARSGAKPSTDATQAFKYATKGGALTLGPNSTIDIQPDGTSLTAAANAVFTPSRVELSGQTIEFQGNATSGASIVAPGGTVNVRAALTPAYNTVNMPDMGNLEQVIVGYADDGTPIRGDHDDTSGRILMNDHVKIDVSGTKDTTVSVARNFVTAPYVGEQDISDAPMQKDSPIFHHDVTFDIRSKPPILTKLDGYTNAVQETAGEFLSTGGKVVLSATGSVAMSTGASINVSGGAVNYTGAYVSPSILYGADGTRYTFNTAPADVKIVGMVGLDNEGKLTRFGVVPASNVNTLGVWEPGYTDGRGAGSLSVYAPVALMDGQLAGGVIMGTRQKAGLDPLAAAGVLRLGTASNGGDDAAMGKSAFLTAVLRDLRVTAHAGSDVLDSVSRISADQINAGGFGQLLFSADTRIEQQAGADLNLPALSTVTWQTQGETTLGANIVSKGGKVTAAAYTTTSTGAASGVPVTVPVVTVKAGSLINVSGNWVNQRLDGKGVAAAVAGGDINLLSAFKLSLESGAHLNVSGGVTVTPTSTFVGTSAGNIKLEGLNDLTQSSSNDAVTIGQGVSLEGYGLTTGGTLRFKAGAITVAGLGNDLVQATDGSYAVGSGFFNQGGFQSFDLEGVNGLTIASDARIAPQVKTWQVQARGLMAATGSAVSKSVQVDQRTNILRKPVNMTFSSLGFGDGMGVVKMQAGARIDANPLAKVSFNAAHAIDLDGVVIAKGGTISANLSAQEEGNAINNHIEVGPQAVLDVSGGVQYTPNASGLLTGTVYDGGTISLIETTSTATNAYDVSIDIKQGAQLIADGGNGVVDVARPLGSFGPAYTRQTLASNGGTIVISAGAGGAYLGGEMRADAGNDTARGGTLSLALGGGLRDRTKGLSGQTFTLTVQDAPLAKDGSPVQNQMTVSTKMVKDGKFNSLYLQSADEIYFVGGDDADHSVSLKMRDHLSLDAAALRADAGKGTTVNLSGGSTLQLGYSADPDSTDRTLVSTTQAIAGNATLNASGGLVELFGTQATQGFGAVKVNSQSELRLRGVGKPLTTRSVGAFNSLAQLTFNAKQVTPTTATDYTINTNQKVTFGKGDASAQTPLSAQATLTVNADEIEQGGVIRVPFGQITLKANTFIELMDGSVTSVSGEDLLVPYGSTIEGGKTLQYNGADITSLKGKAITVDASGETVKADAGATLNLNGGGKLVAWEFVAGPGGSKDIFAGSVDGAFAIIPTVQSYAPYDTSIVTGGGLSLNPSASNALSLGNTLTFGAGSVVPAGTYAVLPARYALLPGAYLVKPNGSLANVALGFVQNKADGSQVVAAVKGVAGGSAASNAVASAYTVMTGELARRYSEIRNTDLDTYMTNKAVTAGAALPALMGDAGRLSVLANKLTLDAQIQFEHLSKYRGGQLDIASNAIHVGDGAKANTLNLTYAQLNASKADSILLGGVRADADEDGVSAVTVTASNVTVDASSNALSVGDISFAATDTVTVADGARIEAADGVTQVSKLGFSGDGALLRVSSDATATSTRAAPAFQQGTLSLGKNITLTGGSITAEATLSNSIDTSLASSSKIKSEALTVGANRIAVGETNGLTPDGSPLVINAALAEQFNQAKDLTLRSFSTVDMYGNSQLGSSTTRSLTIDSAAIDVKKSAAVANVPKATLTAGAVTLTNTTTLSRKEATGDGTLSVEATGDNGGSGHVTVAGGAMAVMGAKATTLSAAGSVVMQGQGSLTVAGDLGLQAQTLTTSRAADGKLTASGGKFSLDKRGGSVLAATPGAGGALQIEADAVSQAGRIVMPSGKLTIASNQQSVNFGATSVTDLSGLAKTIDGQALTTVGGDLIVTAKSGDITAAQGSVLNVSAGLGKSSAGSMTFSAINGKVDLQGQLLATSAKGQTGGRLSIDARDAVDVAVLADRIAAQTTSEVGNFAKSITLRNRQADLTVGAGTTLSASNINLSTDAGKLTVSGSLHANGDTGGKMWLNAGSMDAPAGTNMDVVIANGADIQAKALAEGGVGGSVMIGVGSEQGTIRLDGGTIDTSGNKASDGTLTLRAIRTADSTDINIDEIKTTLVGVKSVTIEATQVYKDITTLTDANLTDYKRDVRTYLNSYTQSIASKLAASQADLVDKLRIRAGVEVRSTGNLDVSEALSLTTSYTADNGSEPADPMAPINLTLRAADNLNVAANISAGFTATAANGLPQSGQAGDIRLIGGADLNAADVMATTAPHLVAGADPNAIPAPETVGDVTISSGAVVRSTTGNIAIAAGQDVKLQDGAAIYTTGTVVPALGLTGFTKPSGLGYQNQGNATNLFVSNSMATPFLTGGGSVSIKAGRDVVGSTTDTPQSASAWFNRYLSKTLLTYWASRYDKFTQGFATFGGGDVDITAGRDALRVNADALSSGYATTAAVPYSFGGGSVSLKSGRDVVGGFVLVTVDTSVDAGRSIVNAARDSDDTDSKSLTLAFGNNDASVRARNDLTLDRVTHEINLSAGQTIYWPFGDATLDVAATAGDLAYRSTTKDYLPGDTSFTSASGNLRLSSFQQAPALKTVLSILASGDVMIGNVNQIGVEGLTDQVTMKPKAIGGPTFAGLDTTSLSGEDSSPTRIVAETGSVAYGVSLFGGNAAESDARLITPLRMIAGLDIKEGGTSGLSVQHQNVNDVSLIQAGRDYLFFDEQAGKGLRIEGPGDAVIVTGRNLDLRSGNGIVADGNSVNRALPAGSAAITILNGVSFSAGDITDAVKAYYPLLGGTGVGAFPEWLYTQIKLGTQTPGTPQADAIAAQAKADLATSNILDVARALAGEQAYQDAVVGFVNHREDGGLSGAQALQAFATASSHDQALVAGQLLSKVWAATVPDALRQQQVLSLVPANAGTAQSLINFVAQRAGQDSGTLTLSAALDRFSLMSTEQQALLVTQTLSREVAEAIVSAAQKPQGPARNVDYAKAYDALSTVFPHATAQTASVDMGVSQIKTYQDSPVSMFSPNGGVNVGQLVSNNTKGQADLGLVTAAGGDVSILVRDSVAVNASRVFTLNHGDETLWASLGDVDAGRGAKTVTSAPNPSYYFDQGVLKIDVSSAISGSGIASSGSAFIAAPKGQINAGDAGISTKGTLFLIAPVIIGGDNIHATATVGAPPAPSVNLAAVAAVPTQPTAAGPADEQSKEDNAKAKKRKRNVILDFLGFGSSDDDADKKAK